jgi:G protein-coupled receptor GPR1
MAFPKNEGSRDTSKAVLSVRLNSSVRGFGAVAGSVGNLSRTQNQAILIVAVIAASISLAIAMISLRWFLSMKRNFRHHLILMLIVSDSFKAVWCLLTPIVIFSCGEIESRSAFSQVSGFLLAAAVEAADLSVLFIALHMTLYVFRPPQKSGHGGLYRYRYWIYGLWVVLPLFVALLAFTNRSGPAYVTSGIMTYLPKRPFWYRLALAWIPRHITIFSIIAMYAAIYIYVEVKFRSFSKFQRDDSSLNTSPARGPVFGQTSHNAGLASPQASLTCDMTSREASGGKPFYVVNV